MPKNVKENKEEIVKDEVIETKEVKVENTQDKKVEQENQLLKDQMELMRKQMEEMMVQMKNMQQNKVVEKEPTLTEENSFETIPANKKIKVMHMVNSSAHFNRGRFKFQFEKIFDTWDFKWDFLQDVYNEFSEWFKTKQLIILNCPEAVEELGLSHLYNEFPTYKEDYLAIIDTKNPDEFIEKVKCIPTEIRPFFVNFYIGQYLEGNPSALDNRKIDKLNKYYDTNINVILSEFTEE